MNQTPFFSVVIPCYNRASFLKHTVHSVFNQTFPDFEIILIDDGSTDDTKNVARQLMESDGRCSYIFQPNGERGKARNNGVKNAKGEFIVFFDSDDEMKSQYLQHLYNGIQKYGNYNFYAGKYKFITNKVEINSSMKAVAAGEHSIELVLKGNPFACNFCIRKANTNLRLFEEDRNLATTEDWIFLVENLQKDRMMVLDFIGVNMQIHEGRSMQQNGLLIERRLKATELLLNKLAFPKKEQKLLWAHTYHFCSVHAYLDDNRKLSLYYLFKAIHADGLKTKWMMSLVKYLAGRSWVLMLKRRMQKHE